MAATVPFASGSHIGTSHFTRGARERATSGGPLRGNCVCLAVPAGAEMRLEWEAAVWSVSRLAAPPTTSDRPSCEGFVDICDGAVLGDARVGGDVEGTPGTMPRFSAVLSLIHI